MQNIILRIKQSSLTFLSLNLYILIMILIPKDYSEIFGLPIRLFLTVILIFIALLEIKTKKILINKRKTIYLFILFALFILSTIPSLFVTKSLITSLYTIVKFISVFILFLLLYKIEFKKEEYSFIFKNFVFCTFIVLILGVIEYIFGLDLMIRDSGIYYYPGAKGRLTTTFFNPIYFGIYINLVFAVAFYFMNKLENKKVVCILALLCLLLYANLIFTFTRSAIIVFFAILVILLILLNKFIFKLRTLIVLIGIVLITILIPGGKPLFQKSFSDVYSIVSKFSNVLSFLPSIDKPSINLSDNTQKEPATDKPSINLSDNTQKEPTTDIKPSNDNSEITDSKTDDYSDNKDYSDYSLQHREIFAKIAKKIANDNLYTGVGFGAYINYMNSNEFDMKYPDYNASKTHPHSAVTLMFSEVGIFGLFLFCLILIALLFKSLSAMIRNFKYNKFAYQIAVIAFAICSGFIVVNVMSENAFYDTQICYIFITIYALLLNFSNFNEKKNRVLFVASTGGHLNELLQLEKLFDKYDSYLITEKTKSTKSLKKKYQKVDYLVYGTKDHKFKYIFKFMINCIKSIWYFIKINPKVIVTTGTHTAVPICYIGKLFGSKIIFIETFANSNSKTLSGKLVYPISDTFIVQWKGMVGLYPNAIYGGWIY